MTLKLLENALDVRCDDYLTFPRYARRLSRTRAERWRNVELRAAWTLARLSRWRWLASLVLWFVRLEGSPQRPAVDV